MSSHVCWHNICCYFLEPNSSVIAGCRSIMNIKPIFLMWSQSNQDHERERYARENSKVITWSTTYQSLSPGYLGKSKVLYSLFCLMTPIYLGHLLSLLTQTRLKRKPCFQVFILSISTILLLGGEEEGVLFTATSSILMLYPAQQVWQHRSEHISAWWRANCMLSPLCWQTQRKLWNTCWPIFTGHPSPRSFLLDYKKCTVHCTISEL